jgi:tetratricopeptide (TPR) repeat protein
MAGKKYADAAEMAKQCLEFDPVNVDCLKLSGDAHKALGQHEESVKSYLAFLNWAPSDPRAPLIERHLLRTRQMPPQELSVSARQAEAKEMLASAAHRIRAKRYEEAHTFAARCVRLTPDNGECHLLVGVSYAHRGLWDEATPCYRKFLELAPDHQLAPSIRKTLEDLRKP